MNINISIKSSLKICTLCFVYVTLTSCASIILPNQIPISSQPSHEGLEPQILNAGECGMFLWTVASPPIFVFFYKEGSSSAILHSASGEIDLQEKIKSRVLNNATNIVKQYTTADGKEVYVTGKFGDILEGGRRIPKATIQTQNTQGWQKILPVSGVYACR